MNEDKVKDYYSMLEKNGGCGPLVFAAVLVVVLLLASCRTVTVTETVPVETVRIEYRDREKVKEVHDSIYIERVLKGDTVTVREYRWRDRFLAVRDTLVVHDTIPVVTERVVVKTDHSLRPWQKGLVGFSAFLVLLMLVVIYIRLRT